MRSKFHLKTAEDTLLLSFFCRLTIKTPLRSQYSNSAFVLKVFLFAIFVYCVLQKKTQKAKTVFQTDL